MDFFQTRGKKIEIMFFNGTPKSFSGQGDDITSVRSPEEGL